MRCTDGAAGTEDADAGGKTNVTENGQVIGTLPVFLIYDNQKIKSHLLPPESFWKMIFARFSFLKFQKESAIGIADLKKNAYNISVAFFLVSEEITKMAVLTGKMIFHSHRVRRQYRAERCN